MSENKELPKSLPAMEHEFEVELQGNLTKKQYKGAFKFRIPDLKGRGQSDVFRAKLNGGMPEASLDPIIARMHYQIAYLKYTLVEAPGWWKDAEFGYVLRDYNIVEDVMAKCLAYEEMWMLQVWGPKPKEGGEDENGGGKPEGEK